MNFLRNSLLVFIIMFIMQFSIPVLACPAIPVVDVQITPSSWHQVGETVYFDASESYCSDPGTLKFTWIFPAGAYYVHVYGDNGEYAKCKFSPASTEPYIIELTVENLSTELEGQWSDEDDRAVGCDDNEIMIEDYESPWFVKVNGDDDNDGQTWATPFQTIQTAIDSSSDGDEIIVDEGTYWERIYLKGKNITIRSKGPDDWSVTENTIINGYGESAVVIFDGIEDDCQVSGFTITGGGDPYTDPVQENLEGHWELNGNSEDISEYGRDGTASGNPTWPSNGRMEGAVQFDGNDYIQITNYNGVTEDDSRTISAWIKTDSNGPILSWGTNSDGQKWIVQLDSSTGAIKVDIGGGYIVGTAEDLSDGLWHHIAVTWGDEDDEDIEDALLYVDGVLDTLYDSSSETVNTGSANNVYIGYDVFNATYYDGLIDDVRIYSRALEPKEIQELARVRDPVTYLEMDAMPSGEILDEMENNNGTAYGSASINTTDKISGAGCLELVGTGNGYIDLGNFNYMTWNCSISIWFKTSGSSEWLFDSAEDPGSKSPTGTDDWADLYIDSYGELVFRFQCGGNDIIASTSTGDSSVYNDGNWHHVVAVKAGPYTACLYVDGSLKDSETSTGGGIGVDAPSAVNIGRETDETNYFTGLIDNVRMYALALNYNQVRSLYSLGSGIYGNGTSATISNCIIRNNESVLGGGGICNVNGTIQNCLIHHNTSEGNGGGLADCDGNIVNCTIVDNTSNASCDGVYNCGGTIKNSIIWGHGSTFAEQIDTSSTPTYSCVQYWSGSTEYHNISEDPEFIITGENAGKYLLNANENGTPPDPSPCIDAGDPTSDYSLEPFPNGGFVNMGVYGNTADAAISPNSDNDGDGLSWYEEQSLNTSDENADSDGDGMDDYWEYTYGYDEETQVLDPTNGSDADTDYDNDGLTNLEEYLCWDKEGAVVCDPRDEDTDNDETLDGDEDLDSDGITNEEEFAYGLNPLNDNIGDSWTELVYNNDSTDPNEIVWEVQRVYEQSEWVTKVIRLSEFHRVSDDLGRIVMERRLADLAEFGQASTEDGTNDDITFTLYDIGGNVVKTIRKGNGESYSGYPYDDESEPTAEDNDIQIQYAYDDLGRVTTQTDTLNQDTDYEYDTFDNVTLVTLPESRITATEYDAVNRATKVTDSEGHYTESEFDSFGRTIRNVRKNSSNTAIRQQRWEYNGLGELIRQALMADPTAIASSTIDTENDRVTDYENLHDEYKTSYVYTYDGSNTITSITQTDEEDGSGRGRPTQITRGQGTNQPKVVENRSYEPSGRLADSETEYYAEGISPPDPPDLAVTTSYFYDDYGRMTKQRAVGTSENLDTLYTYDGIGRKLTVVDPMGITTAYSYDAFGQMGEKTEDAQSGGLNRATIYQYDRLGNLVTLIANDGTNDQTTEYAYDLAGKVTMITYPDSTHIQYDYNAAGLVATRFVDREVINQVTKKITTAYAYDDLGQLITKSVDMNYDETNDIYEVYAYDAAGNMTLAQKGTSSPYNDISICQLTYDGLGNLTQSSQEVNDSGNTKTVSYVRSQLGRAERITYPDSSATTLEYTYTSLGQVDQITRDPGGTPYLLVAYDYSGNLVSQRVSNGTTYDITFTPEYDEFGRITRHKTLNDATPDEDGADFEYTYDDNGNILTQKFHHRENSPYNLYAYDSLNRLTLADYQAGTAGAEEFEYDLLGNRTDYLDERPTPDTSCSYVHNLANEYTSVCSTSVSHDEAGNLTADHRGFSYEYDYENRLSRVYDDINENGGYDSGTDLSYLEFTYDALGRRIEIQNSSTTYRYYYDDQRVILKTYVSSGESDSRTFVFGNYIDEVLVMRNSSGYDYYYAHDHLFSPVVLFGGTGTVVERYEYDAYGQRSMYSPAWAPRSSSPILNNPFAFTGRELDRVGSTTLWLMYYRARSYDPQTGRFMQRDPLEYIDSINLFEYVKSMPINHLDPYGEAFKIPGDVIEEEEIDSWEELKSTGRGPGIGKPIMDVQHEGCCILSVGREWKWTENNSGKTNGLKKYSYDTSGPLWYNCKETVTEKLYDKMEYTGQVKKRKQKRHWGFGKKYCIYTIEIYAGKGDSRMGRVGMKAHYYKQQKREYWNSLGKKECEEMNEKQ